MQYNFAKKNADRGFLLGSLLIHEQFEPPLLALLARLDCLSVLRLSTRNCKIKMRGWQKTLILSTSACASRPND